jgi:hypothetical protein
MNAEREYCLTDVAACSDELGLLGHLRHLLVDVGAGPRVCSGTIFGASVAHTV